MVNIYLVIFLEENAKLPSPRADKKKYEKKKKPKLVQEETARVWDACAINIQITFFAYTYSLSERVKYTHTYVHRHAHIIL